MNQSARSDELRVRVRFRVAYTSKVTTYDEAAALSIGLQVVSELETCIASRIIRPDVRAEDRTAVTRSRSPDRSLALPRARHGHRGCLRVDRTGRPRRQFVHGGTGSHHAAPRRDQRGDLSDQATPPPTPTACDDDAAGAVVVRSRKAAGEHPGRGVPGAARRRQRPGVMRDLRDAIRGRRGLQRPAGVQALVPQGLRRQVAAGQVHLPALQGSRRLAAPCTAGQP